ncbi:hypothetical protein IWGMT90018_40810 [Mycobacterium kiyosense]|nr:hypothetical protein IWGMT90018_40810 [Mycobacterium kiyosense]
MWPDLAAREKRCAGDCAGRDTEVRGGATAAARRSLTVEVMATDPEPAPPRATVATTERGQRTRAAIIDVAATLMYQNGVSGTSVDDILGRNGHRRKCSSTTTSATNRNWSRRWSNANWSECWQPNRA